MTCVAQAVDNDDNDDGGGEGDDDTVIMMGTLLGREDCGRWCGRTRSRRSSSSLG